MENPLFQKTCVCKSFFFSILLFLEAKHSLYRPGNKSPSRLGQHRAEFHRLALSQFDYDICVSMPVTIAVPPLLDIESNFNGIRPGKPSP
jgi:hypothetical protein